MIAKATCRGSIVANDISDKQSVRFTNAFLLRWFVTWMALTAYPKTMVAVNSQVVVSHRR
jgi:hypothetical protein